jgi:uncharacterized membrane protein
MPWYIWALLSMIAGSFEEIIDKFLLKTPKKIDALIATFYRNLGFFVFTVIAGFLGIFGKMSFVFNINFLILAIIWPLNSLSYDYFLRKVEVSRFNGLFYTFPLIFLFLDSIFFHMPYSQLQIVGALLIVMGSVLFSFDNVRKRFVITFEGFLWLLFKMASYTYLLFLFKFLSSSINEISFYFSIWSLVMVIYIVVVLLTKKHKKLKQTAIANGFLAGTFLSKGFDFLSSVFYLEALSFASLTLVSSFTSFSPLILLVILLLISIHKRANYTEDFSPKVLGLKVIATLILITGGVCMFWFRL